MFLIDLNQITLSNLLAELQGSSDPVIKEDMIRHMILNSLRYNRQKFKKVYGEPILCCDNVNYWRKKIFPYYKASRKKVQQDSSLDWNAIFSFLNKVKQELKDHFPYQVLDVETAEADDIIGTLVHNGILEPILILSGDKDFIQLQVYNNVKQYDPIRKKWVTHEEPDMYLFEHILKGDAGDGIPNVLSPDDCFITGTRQKNMTKKRIDNFHNDANALAGTHYQRNQMLIDLERVPDNIKKNILTQFNEPRASNRSGLLNYFVKHKLRNLLEHVSEF